MHGHTIHKQWTNSPSMYVYISRLFVFRHSESEWDGGKEEGRDTQRPEMGHCRVIITRDTAVENMWLWGSRFASLSSLMELFLHKLHLPCCNITKAYSYEPSIQDNCYTQVPVVTRPMKNRSWPEWVVVADVWYRLASEESKDRCWGNCYQ